MRTLSLVSFAGMAALASVSAHAACGGGGYKPTVVKASAPAVQEVTYTRVDERQSKLADLQRDIDKAQAKFDRCEGKCDKERRRLEEAKAKYAKMASDVPTAR